MLQLIAMITMLIDHVGLVFFGEYKIFRVIGRVAFPLYTWFLVQGYLHTSSIKKYSLRLLWIAILSQIPFMVSLQRWDLNVIFTLLLALISLRILDTGLESIYKTVLIFVIFSTMFFVPMDYGVYGLFLTLIYRFFTGWKIVVYHILLNGFFLSLYGFDYAIQFFSILGTLLIIFNNGNNFRFRINKWVYRYFYPIHLAVIAMFRF